MVTKIAVVILMLTVHHPLLTKDLRENKTPAIRHMIHGSLTSEQLYGAHLASGLQPDLSADPDFPDLRKGARTL